MTSTSVKDVGSAFANLYAGSAQGTACATGAGGFDKIFNNQMNKSAQDDVADAAVKPKREAQAPKDAAVREKEEVEVQKGESLRSKEEKPMEAKPMEAKPVEEKPVEEKSMEEIPDEVKPTEEMFVAERPVEEMPMKENQVEANEVLTEWKMAFGETLELTEEELEAVMEVLGTAAMELMQQIADVFGIEMNQLQAVVNEMGMNTTDVLDATKLGALLLNLGGAADSYALVTDEALYDNYRMLMNQLKTSLDAVAEELGMEPEKLLEVIDSELQMQNASVVAEELPRQEAVQEMKPERNEAESKTVETTENVSIVKSVEAEEQSVMSQSADGRTGGERKSTEENVPVRQANEFAPQSVVTENFQAQIQQTENVYASTTSWDAETQNIMRQIMDYMKIQVNAEATSLEMQLHPASLGTVQVNIASKGGVVTANFVAQNEAVKAALESQMIQLKETFAEQGVKVEAIEVTVQTHEFERNLEQGGRGRGQQENSKRNRTRRINLNDPISMENMEEEDVLAAEMLTAGGSTVDYTA